MKRLTIILLTLSVIGCASIAPYLADLGPMVKTGTVKTIILYVEDHLYTITFNDGEVITFFSTNNWGFIVDKSYSISYIMRDMGSGSQNVIIRVDENK